MPLSNDEERALELIELGLRRQDPVLAGRLDTAPTQDERRRRVLWGHRGFGLGIAFFLIGLISSDGVPSLGAVLAGYGFIILLIAAGIVLRNRTPHPGRPRLAWRFQR